MGLSSSAAAASLVLTRGITNSFPSPETRTSVNRDGPPSRRVTAAIYYAQSGGGGGGDDQDNDGVHYPPTADANTATPTTDRSCKKTIKVRTFHIVRILEYPL